MTWSIVARHAPWMAVWPGLSIFLPVLSFNLLGDDCATRSIRGAHEKRRIAPSRNDGLLNAFYNRRLN